MGTTGKINKRTKINKPGVSGRPSYYFHADEDFREDWDWGKKKEISSKATTKPANSLEM